MNYTLYLAVLIGAIMYFVIDLVGRHGKEVFTFKYLLAMVANILAGFALIWLTELKEGLMTIGWFDAAKIIAASFGVIGQKLFKTLIDLASKNVKTTIGINKK